MASWTGSSRPSPTATNLTPQERGPSAPKQRLRVRRERRSLTSGRRLSRPPFLTAPSSMWLSYAGDTLLSLDRVTLDTEGSRGRPPQPYLKGVSGLALPED